MLTNMNINWNINKFFNKKRSVTITEYDPTYKVVYLGNVLTAWAKGDGCIDKPLATLWRSYCQSLKPDVAMKVTVCTSGLKATTKEHGLTEYWSNRITYCAAHPQYPKVFCWVYRHEGRKLKQELRCHAVLCAREETARQMANQLKSKLSQALYEFKREKICRQNARLSLANCVYENPSLPRRKILLSTGTVNYRPPLDRCRSAPRLGAIEETVEESSGVEGITTAAADDRSPRGRQQQKGRFLESDLRLNPSENVTAALRARRLSAPASTFWVGNNNFNNNNRGGIVTEGIPTITLRARKYSTPNGLFRPGNHHLSYRTGVIRAEHDDPDLVNEEERRHCIDEEDEDDVVVDDDDQHDEEEEDTTSDIVADEDNLSDQYGYPNDTDGDGDSVEESPSGRTQLTSIDETADEDDVEIDGRRDRVRDVPGDEDNISDESGYSEENERDYICKM